MTRNEAPRLLDDLRRIERLIPPAFASALGADLLSDDIENLVFFRKAPGLELRIDERSIDRDFEAPTRRRLQLCLGNVGVKFFQQ